MPQAKDTDWLNGYKNKTHMLSTRDPLQIQGHLQTESEGMEKAITCKCKSTVSLSNNIHYQTKQTLNTVTRNMGGHYIMMNLRRSYKSNIYIYICAQHRSTLLYKANANIHRRRNQQEHSNSGSFSTTLTPMDKSSRQKITKETQALDDILDKMDLIDILEHSI